MERVGQFFGKNSGETGDLDPAMKTGMFDVSEQFPKANKPGPEKLSMPTAPAAAESVHQVNITDAENQAREIRIDSPESK